MNTHTNHRGGEHLITMPKVHDAASSSKKPAYESCGLPRTNSVRALFSRFLPAAARTVSAVWAAIVVPWLIEDDMEMQVYTGRRD